MSFEGLYDFLEELQQNNSKEWMDAHRKRYLSLRNWYVNWLEQLNAKLAAVDDDYFYTSGKKAINRINNNLLFHPNKPVYKDHFGAGLDQKTKQGDFYIQLGVSESFIASGYWKPDSKLLNSIRQAIDYNGEELISIMEDKTFKDAFGGFIDTDHKLKTTPKGYSKTHPHIDLLRHKTFAVAAQLSREEVMHPDFDQKIVHLYKILLPFRRYLNKAVTVLEA